MARLVDIRIPEDQQEGTELEMGAWLKKVGDRVEKDEPIAELVTDKAVVELPAPASGVIAEILVEAETSVTELDTLLGRIDTAGASVGGPETAAGASAPSSGRRGRTRGDNPQSPSARRARRAQSEAEPPRHDRPAAHAAVIRYARLKEVDLAAVEGSGWLGRVTADDLRNALGESEASAPRDGANPPTAPQLDLGPSRRVRHGPMRRAIARNMAESVQVAPHVTAMFECDMARVVAHRAACKADFASRGVKLTFSAYFVRAAVAALRAVPETNSRWHDDALEVFEQAHIGVGTALEDRGLVVPVVRRAESLDLEATARALGGLIDKARGGKLSAAEMRGSTFTISNHGVMGSLMASPIIIQQPESAILGVGKLERRPVVMEGDRIEVRPRMYVTLTIDHRALDAFHTNRFLSTFCETLENWPAASS